MTVPTMAPVEDPSLLLLLKMKAVECYVWFHQADLVPDELEPVFLVLALVNVLLALEIQCYRNEKRSWQEGTERWMIRVSRVWRRRGRRFRGALGILPR